MSSDPGSVGKGAHGELDTQHTTLPGPVSFRRIQELIQHQGEDIAVGERLAQGANGEIRVARQVRLGRDVAVKLPRRGDVFAVGSVVQEAWVAAYLDHPHIVPVYDIVLHEGVPCVVMKKLEGVAWAELLHDPGEVARRFGAYDPLEWHLRTLIAVCRAVEYAHSRGVLHGDLKPANVMIGQFGEVWVVDWGNALALPGAQIELRAAASVNNPNGTPSYMAPEQARGDGRAMGPHTDVFGLGAVLYEVITGKVPRRGTMAEVLRRAAKEPLEVKATWPLGDLLADALQLDPQRRPAHVEAFRTRIGAFLERRGGERVLTAARGKLRALRSVLEAETVDRGVAYDTFGACRFGFVAAREALPDHPKAVEGLREAQELMLRYELSQGDARACRLLLDQLDEAPGALREEVEALEEARAEEQRMLARFQEDEDPETAWWARFGVSVVLGIIWACTPVGSVILGLPRGFGREMFIAGTTFFASLVAMGLLWPWLIRSRLNRVMISMVVAGPGLALLLNIGLWLGGFDHRLSNPIELFVYFVCALVVVMLAEWRLVVGALGFLAAFFVSMLWPDHALVWMNAANLLLVANTTAVWGWMAWRKLAPADEPLLTRRPTR